MWRYAQTQLKLAVTYCRSMYNALLILALIFLKIFLVTLALCCLLVHYNVVCLAAAFIVYITT